MAALFLLNIYHKKDSFNLGKDSNGVSFDNRLGSELFSIKIHVNTSTSQDTTYIKKEDFDECTYIARTTLDSAQIFRDSMKRVNTESDRLTKEYLLKNSQNIDKKELFNTKIKFVKQAAESQNLQFEQLRYEAIINMHQV